MGQCKHFSPTEALFALDFEITVTKFIPAMNSLVDIVFNNGFKHELIGKIKKATTASVEADIFTLITDNKNKTEIVNEITKLLIIKPILTRVCINFIFESENLIDSCNMVIIAI